MSNVVEAAVKAALAAEKKAMGTKSMEDYLSAEKAYNDAARAASNASYVSGLPVADVERLRGLAKDLNGNGDRLRKKADKAWRASYPEFDSLRVGQEFWFPENRMVFRYSDDGPFWKRSARGYIGILKGGYYDLLVGSAKVPVRPGRVLSSDELAALREKVKDTSRKGKAEARRYAKIPKMTPRTGGLFGS